MHTGWSDPLMVTVYLPGKCTRVPRRCGRAARGASRVPGGNWLYTNAMPEYFRITERHFKATDLRFSLGFVVKEDGISWMSCPIRTRRQGGDWLGHETGGWPSTAGAGPLNFFAPQSKQAVTAQAWNFWLRTEIYFSSFKIDYHEGEKYPVLARDETKPDLLSAILKPLTPAP